MFGGTLYTISIWIMPVLLAVTLHEAAHGYAAMRLGDDTALRAGRLSLNPLRHIAPIIKQRSLAWNLQSKSISN